MTPEEKKQHIISGLNQVSLAFGVPPVFIITIKSKINSMKDYEIDKAAEILKDIAKTL